MNVLLTALNANNVDTQNDNAMITKARHKLTAVLLGERNSINVNLL